jgi:dihydrolipoamide dehydrogenase
METEVVVIGAGPAGYVCAIRLAQLGKKVTVIERDVVGGVCLNRGCIPSKALIHVGNTLDRMKHASALGLDIGNIKTNFSKVMEFKAGVVKKLTTGVAGLLKANGCEVITGDAKFTSPTSLSVQSKDGTKTLKFQHAVIATGSRPAAIPGFNVDQKRILDSTGGLDQADLPKSLLCVGGGYIGLELGTFYAKMGTKVTVVEAGPALLSTIDADLVRVVEKRLTALGVVVHKATQVKEVKSTASGVSVQLVGPAGPGAMDVDKVLVTIGRTPNTDNLDLARAGVKVDGKGFIAVDPRRASNVQNIYAIGDVAGQPLLAHKGSKEGIVAAEAIAGKATVYDVHAMPAVIFTDPEIASVGVTEAEAKAKGLNVKISAFPFAANGRALSVAESDGFAKVISDTKSGRLLGVHIVGCEASNLIAEATLAIEMGANVEDLALTVHAHPTLPEVLMEAGELAMGHPIHIFKRA